MQVGFIGTGAMGAAMVGHICRKGYKVLAYDRDATALDAAVAAGAKASDPAGIARAADVLIVMVATDDQSRDVVKDVLEAGARPGAVIVVAGTNRPAAMVELAERATAAGVGFVDAPVVYGLQGAKTGDLVSLCGGTGEDVGKVRPVLMCYSRSVEHIGGPGAGQIAKTCNNMLHWAACVANYEALALARACGLDAQQMRETLLKCPARNTTLERWDTTRFTWHEKDMDVALDLAQGYELPLPLFGLVDQLVKRIGPDDVRALLYGDGGSYLGRPVVEG